MLSYDDFSYNEHNLFFWFWMKAHTHLTKQLKDSASVCQERCRNRFPGNSLPNDVSVSVVWQKNKSIFVHSQNTHNEATGKAESLSTLQNINNVRCRLLEMYTVQKCLEHDNLLLELILPPFEKQAVKENHRGNMIIALVPSLSNPLQSLFRVSTFLLSWQRKYYLVHTGPY